MAAVVTRSEMKTLWKSSVKSMIMECRMNKKAPEGLVELIRHNLFAKYVSYNPTTEQIEIGVNEALQPARTYPTITVSHIPLGQLEQRLKASYKPKRIDMEFYAKILTGKDLNDQVLVL